MVITSGDPLVSVFDSITVTESISVFIPTFKVNVSDDILVSEVAQISYSLPSSILDTVSVTEDISIAVTLVLTVIENITVTESISNSSESSISVFDGVNVSEDFSSLIVTQPVFTVVEDIVVSENIAFDILVVVNVFDSVGVSDEFSPSVVSFVSVNDSISLSDTYGFVTNIYGYNVPEYRPIGTIVSYNQLMGDAE